MSRRHHGSIGSMFQLPTLPFLSIMLGLMSVMALMTIGMSVKQRAEERERTGVELVGVPANFVPFHIRCTKEHYYWRPDGDTWQKAELQRLFDLARGPMDGSDSMSATRQIRRMLQHILLKVEENKQLSFQRRQNTLILWIEPDGGDSAGFLQAMVSQMNLPLRIGSLPIMPNEAIRDVSP